MSALLQFNYMLFQDVNAYAGQVPWLDACMVFCANLLIFLWPILLLMVWGVPLSWRRRAVQPGEVEIIQERRAAVLWTAIACLVAYGVNLLIEQFIFEPRPFVNHKVHLLLAHAADSSFPSDHTAWSFAVVGMLAFAFLPTFIPLHEKGQQFDTTALRKLLMFLIVACVMACIIGLARVFVGVHYPGDILGGAVDGLVAALLVTALRRWLSRPTNAVLRFAHTLRLA